MSDNKMTKLIIPKIKASNLASLNDKLTPNDKLSTNDKLKKNTTDPKQTKDQSGLHSLS